MVRYLPLCIFSCLINGHFYHNIAHLLISGHTMIPWVFLMGVQTHHPCCWDIHIVVIPCHLAKSLPATNSSFIFILIMLTLQLDSNWNIMQQVRTIAHCLDLDLDLNEQKTRHLYWQWFYIWKKNRIKKEKRKKILWLEM